MLCACGCGQPTKIANRNDPHYGHIKGQPVKYLKGHHWRGTKRPLKLGRKCVRRLSINTSIFHSWSPPMAYALGIIATDGWVTTSHKLSLTNTDQEMPEALKSILSSEAPIIIQYPLVGKPQHGIHIRCRDICLDLERLGIKPNKSLTLPWINVPDGMMSFFLRGVFDGDGSVILQSTSNSPKLSVSFTTGSYQFAIGLQATIKHMLNCNVGLYRTTNKGRVNPYFHVVMHHHASIAFYHWIYGNMSMSFHLSRKKAQFEKADLTMPVCIVCGCSLVRYKKGTHYCHVCSPYWEYNHKRSQDTQSASPQHDVSSTGILTSIFPSCCSAPSCTQAFWSYSVGTTSPISQELGTKASSRMIFRHCKRSCNN